MIAEKKEREIYSASMCAPFGVRSCELLLSRSGMKSWCENSSFCFFFRECSGTGVSPVRTEGKLADDLFQETHRRDARATLSPFLTQPLNSALPHSKYFLQHRFDTTMFRFETRAEGTSVIASDLWRNPCAPQWIGRWAASGRKRC